MNLDIFKEFNSILINKEKPSIEIELLMNNADFKQSHLGILNKLKNVPQEKEFHPEGNVWNHTKLVIDNAAKVKSFSEDSNSFMWAALFHDIGKIETTKFIKGRYRSYNHDKVGKNVTKNILINYMDEEKANKIAEIVSFHMHHIYILKDLPFSNIPKLIKSKYYDDIIMLFICDKLGRGNNTYDEKEKALNEVNIILDKLQKEDNKINDSIMKKLKEIKNILI